MGSSYTEFRGRGFWTRDGLLEIWLFAMSRRIPRLPDTPSWLIDAADTWQTAATAGFIGCVSADLDRLVGNGPERVVVVRQLSDEVQRSFGSRTFVPAEELNAAGVGGSGTTWIADLPTDFAPTLGREFQTLLGGADAGSPVASGGEGAP